MAKRAKTIARTPGLDGSTGLERMAPLDDTSCGKTDPLGKASYADCVR